MSNAFKYGKKNFRKGILHLIPTPIGKNPPFQVIPISVKKEISSLTNFIVESERNARRFIKKIIPNKKVMHFFWVK